MHICITTPKERCWLQLNYAFVLVNHDDPDPAGFVFRGTVTTSKYDQPK